MVGFWSRIGVLGVVLMTMGVNGCASYVRLRRSPSEAVLISIAQNNRERLNLTVDSRLADPMRYEDRRMIPFNEAYRDSLGSYVRTKFNPSAVAAAVDLQVSVESLALNHAFAMNGGRILTSMVSRQAAAQQPLGQGSVDALLRLHLKVSRNGVVVGEKDVLAPSRISRPLYDNSGWDSLFAEAVDETMNVSIIMIDKYLVSLGL